MEKQNDAEKTAITSNGVLAEVKKIYFTTDIYGKKIHQPYFEMEDGTIKKPYYRMWYGINKTVWLTDDEFLIEQRKMLDESKKDKWWKLW